MEHFLNSIHEQQNVIFVDCFVLLECQADRCLSLNYLLRHHFCRVHSSFVQLILKDFVFVFFHFLFYQRQIVRYLRLTHCS